MSDGRTRDERVQGQIGIGAGAILTMTWVSLWAMFGLTVDWLSVFVFSTVLLAVSAFSARRWRRS